MAVGEGLPAVGDPRQAVPLYHQIFVQLREEIVGGERPFGSRMPTEQELSGQFGVSRITARRALDELAEHGLVARRRRVGTHVIHQQVARPFQGNIDEAIESLLKFGRSTEVKLLEIDQVPARPPIDEALKVTPGTTISRIVRVRWLDGQPLGHFVSYVPNDLAQKMTRAQLKSTPMLALIEAAGVEIASATQIIAATLADTSVSESLQVDVGSPILRVTRTVSDKAGRPVQHIVGQFRPDRYQIRLDLKSPKGGPALS